jgi:hypothetical protein
LLGTGTPLDAADDAGGVPAEFALNGIYPNPFNPATTVSFSLPQPSDVTLIVYDITGREVEQLVAGRLSAGTHQINWSCPACAAGVYLVSLEAGTFRAVTKAVYLK